MFPSHMAAWLASQASWARLSPQLASSVQTSAPATVSDPDTSTSPVIVPPARPSTLVTREAPSWQRSSPSAPMAAMNQPGAQAPWGDVMPVRPEPSPTNVAAVTLPLTTRSPLARSSAVTGSKPSAASSMQPVQSRPLASPATIAWRASKAYGTDVTRTRGRSSSPSIDMASHTESFCSKSAAGSGFTVPRIVE